jgi:hypothetical protein
LVVELAEPNLDATTLDADAFARIAAILVRRIISAREFRIVRAPATVAARREDAAAVFAEAPHRGLCVVFHPEHGRALRGPVLRYAGEMRNLSILLAATICCTACGGDDPPPSCQQAVTHYYAAGCMFVMTNGQAFAELDVIADCKGALAASPSAACDDALADLRVCMGDVPSPAKSNADCDCSAEQDAFISACN